MIHDNRLLLTIVLGIPDDHDNRLLLTIVLGIPQYRHFYARCSSKRVFIACCFLRFRRRQNLR